MYLRFAVEVNISPESTSKLIYVNSIIGLRINVSKRLQCEAYCILGASKAHITQDWRNHLRTLIIRVQTNDKNGQSNLNLY